MSADKHLTIPGALECDSGSVERLTIDTMRYAGGKEHDVRYVSEVHYDAALAREAALREELDLLKPTLESTFDAAQRDRAERDVLQQRMTVAEQRAGVMEKALMRIARPHDCGCLPCTGDCTSKLSLEITVDCMRETAEAALKPAAECPHNYSNPTGCPVCQGIKP